MDSTDNYECLAEIPECKRGDEFDERRFEAWLTAHSLRRDAVFAPATNPSSEDDGLISCRSRDQPDNNIGGNNRGGIIQMNRLVCSPTVVGVNEEVDVTGDFRCDVLSGQDPQQTPVFAILPVQFTT